MIPSFRTTSTEENNTPLPVIETGNLFIDVAVQCISDNVNKSVQVNINQYIGIVSLWNSDKKLNTMTGIPTLTILNTLVDICKDIRPNSTCVTSMRARVLLTMVSSNTTQRLDC